MSPIHLNTIHTNTAVMNMHQKHSLKRPPALILLALALSAAAFAQTTTPDPKAVPVIDGAIGPCSADFIITDAAGAPVYAAKIKVHIAYRFMSLHKLDLEISTNADGKARFTGLPDRLKHGLYFYASEGDRTGQVFDDPTTTCQAQFAVILQKKPQQSTDRGRFLPSTSRAANSCTLRPDKHPS
jgi:hypothetical protein